MRRDFTWTFTVANVKVPILGADFLAHYALAVHMNPRTLSDTTTNLRVLGTPTRQGSKGISVATFHGREYLDLLTQFTDITLPLQVTASGDHQTQHHIRTRGPPAHSHPRRLAPQKLAYAKEQFDKMLSDGIIRPSDSPYASPLHLFLRRTDKHLTIKRANSTDTVAIDRTKPAFLEKRQYDANPALQPPNAIPGHPAHAAPQTSDDTPATPVQQTRSGRRITFPKDLRKYYY
ncbi:unnamed protein product [Acanthosepion pharaonis]|uniref:Uncharacterized protein n=1 Tax=Acanthosepion pharaonis TaxID=158019 RepID=A0A812DCC5_ACAPH|nr:unnamed protein product [Sepia pharaonis]